MDYSKWKEDKGDVFEDGENEGFFRQGVNRAEEQDKAIGEGQVEADEGEIGT